MSFKGTDASSARCSPSPVLISALRGHRAGGFEARRRAGSALGAAADRGQKGRGDHGPLAVPGERATKLSHYFAEGWNTEKAIFTVAIYERAGRNLLDLWQIPVHLDEHQTELSIRTEVTAQDEVHRGATHQTCGIRFVMLE